MTTTKPEKSTAAPYVRYQDYVIRDGRFIGQFEEMYRESTDVPWHQDQTAHAIFSDITVAIIRRCQPGNLLDVGCGLGFMTERLRSEVPSLARVVGLDVSETAIAKAMAMFPEIEFHAGSIGTDLGGQCFDVVTSKDVLWYVLNDLTGYLAALAGKSRRWVYIGQSFPQRRPYLGEDVFPNAEALFRFISDQSFRIEYSVVERDAKYEGREYAHVLFEAVQ